MEAEAELHPKHLAEALDNAILFSKEKHPVNTTIEVAISGGKLRATGWTRWHALIDRRPLESSEGESSVVVDYAEAEELVKTGVRKMQGFSAKGSQVAVRLSQEAAEVMDGSTVLGRLERSPDADRYEGDDESMGAYEYLRLLEREELPGELRKMRITREMLPLFGKIKMSRIEDGKWVSAQDEDPMDFYALKERVVGVKYGTACLMQVNAGVVELDDD